MAYQLTVKEGGMKKKPANRTVVPFSPHNSFRYLLTKCSQQDTMT